MEREGMQSLADRRVLVSGGTTGIGRAIVELLVNSNAKVATFARTQEDVDELQKLHPEVAGFVADLADFDSVRDVFSKATEGLGGLDALVNNAGIGGKSVTESGFDEWKEVLDVNLVAPMLLTQLAAEKMGSGSHIVNIGSLSAKSRDEGSDVYVASKLGLRGFSDSVGRLLGEKGVIVTLIEPGKVVSDMAAENSNDSELEKERSEDKIIESADIARAVLFVLSQPERMVIAEMQIRPRAQLI